MFLRYTKYYCLTLTSLAFSICGNAQLGGLGGPLLNLTFGDPASYNLSVAGPPLALGSTTFPYTTDVCPAPGYYTVVSGITRACFNNSWIPLLSDNTPFPDNNGYMMLINDKAYSVAKTLFEYRLREVCSDVNYQFSASIINLDDPATSGCRRFSSLTLKVEDTLGNLIASTTTGDIQFAIYNRGYNFTKYVVNFMLPLGLNNGAVVKIIDEAKIISGCSNGLAIDDIKVAVAGPKVNIGFDATPVGEWVKSVCFQDNKSLTMHGTIDSGIVNPLVQWQQSIDDGYTWTDIIGATGYSYTRNFSVPDTFLFRIRAADSAHISFPNCGISSDLLKVQVDGLPSNYKITNNSPVCAGQDLIFNAIGGTSYIWTGPNGFYDNIPYPHIFNSSLQDSGFYYVDVSSQGGCHVKDSTHATIIGTDVHAGPDTAVCKEGVVHLHTSKGVSYLWSPANGLSNVTVIDPVAKPDVTTDYTVKVTDKYGCSDTAHVKVIVLNKTPVKAVVSATDYLCRSYDSVYFKSNSLGDIKNWLWDFGNGQTSLLPSPPVQNYFIPANSNSYLVQLTVTDTAGCRDIAYHKLKIADNCYIAVPSAFTPNNDGLNDYLYPLNAYKATNLSFRVYNRLGQIVFKTNDWNNKWDGKIGGLEQATGVYVWMLDYIDVSGKPVSRKGTTVLIR
jgi:gliding motility-associated-like protein